MLLDSYFLKHALGYDDSFDVFGVHGVGGIVGALLTGLFFIKADTGAEYIENNLKGQIVSVIVTIIWSGVVSYIALKIADVFCGGIRSTEDEEIQGLTWPTMVRKVTSSNPQGL